MRNINIDLQFTTRIHMDAEKKKVIQNHEIVSLQKNILPILIGVPFVKVFIKLFYKFNIQGVWRFRKNHNTTDSNPPS